MGEAAKEVVGAAAGEVVGEVNWPARPSGRWHVALQYSGPPSSSQPTCGCLRATVARASTTLACASPPSTSLVLNTRSPTSSLWKRCKVPLWRASSQVTTSRPKACQDRGQRQSTRMRLSLMHGAGVHSDDTACCPDWRWGCCEQGPTLAPAGLALLLGGVPDRAWTWPGMVSRCLGPGVQTRV